MADLLTLTETKLHLRLDPDNDEDAAIGAMIAAATAATADYLNAAAPLDDTAPAPIKAATLLMVADLYENRERQSAEPYYQNKTYQLLLNPYRTMEL